MSEVYKKIPVIAHYTKFETVFKILESKILFATHYRFLNDTSEVHYAKELLIRECIRIQSNTNIEFGEIFDDEAVKWVESLYQSLGNELYITSFCAYETISCPSQGVLNPISPKDELGLLSMWRGYGGEGGCAMVFDTKELEESKFTDFAFERVKYEGLYNDDKEFKEKLEIVAKSLHEYSVGNRTSLDNGQLLRAFLQVIPFFKHYGFHEEKEVRLVVLRDLPKNNGVSELGKNKPVFYLSDGRPYIKMPLDVNIIKKIIIGPYVNQKLRVENLKHFVQQTEGLGHIEVKSSSIPFLGK